MKSYYPEVNEMTTHLEQVSFHIYT